MNINEPVKNVRTSGEMAGFDTEFRSLDEYIRVITARIWEGRRIDDIYRYYSDPCVVETPSSTATALADVVNGTRATLDMFPDRRLLAEDIIISGDAVGGYLSSHRIISPMTHRGDGDFGKATGRKIHVRTVADCVCKDNRIVHEWLVRDQGAIALQIGIAPRDLARQWLDERGGWRKPLAPPAPQFYHSYVSANSTARMYANTVGGFANGEEAHASEMADVYDEAVHHIGPCNCTRFGHAEVEAFWRQLFSVFAVQKFSVEHLAFQQNGGRSDRAALRWRAQAIHERDGEFGAATGKPIEIMGINHVEFFRGKVLREWVLVDDVALWMQVLA